MQHSKDLFIDGEWRDGNGSVMISENPATGSSLWSGHAASKEQVIQAIDAARDAFGGWSSLSVEQRCQYLEKFTKIVTERQQALAETLSQEMGKPLWEAKTEITAIIGKFEISKQAYAERCKEVTKDIQGVKSVTRHKPHGVVVVIGPFNFPGHLPNGHILPALLAGNTVIFKPSELTPLFAIKMIECWQYAELPAGVINLIQGHGDVGEQLVASDQIDGVFFTGSFTTGHHIETVSLNFPKRIVAAEMGGNNPLVVYKPHNIDAAVYNTIQSAYSTSGQRCTCARRLIVHKDSIGEEFIQRLSEVTAKIAVGAYTDSPEPFMGPVISNAAADKILAGYQRWIAAGAKVLVPLKRLKENLSFLSPGLIDVTDVKTQDDEEIFGPLLRLTWVKDFNAAITTANNTGYGLSAGIICEDANLYQEFLHFINAGIVTWNRPTVGSSSSAPFGGVGKSGNHRPSAYYTADYCSYPVASMEDAKLEVPEKLLSGITL